MSTRSDEPSSNGIVVPETRAQTSWWRRAFARRHVGLIAELVLEQSASASRIPPRASASARARASRLRTTM
jgi:hypothetical protein